MTIEATLFHFETSFACEPQLILQALYLSIFQMPTTASFDCHPLPQLPKYQQLFRPLDGSQS